jgi:hypothetical protein
MSRQTFFVVALQPLFIAIWSRDAKVEKLPALLVVHE